MFHCFVTADQIKEQEILILGTDVNHMKNVLRMKQGEEVFVSMNEGRSFHCEVKVLYEESIELRILSEIFENRELPSKIYLFQGLPKSDKMELIIQKAVELGVYKIIPMATKRAIVKLDAKKEETKLKRWNDIAKSAAKQSMRMMIPEVASVMTFQKALELVRDFSVKVIPYEKEEGFVKTREVIGNLKSGMDIAVFIGPEGGFEEDEIAHANALGIIPISLGKRILRTETAGMSVLSMMVYQLEGV